MMDEHIAKRSADTQNDAAADKRAKLDGQAPLDLSLLNNDNPMKQDEGTNSNNENAQEVNGVTIPEKVNAYIESLQMEKIPNTPLYTKIGKGERMIFFEAGFLTIITSKGNKRQPVDFSKINMAEFNKAIGEASVIMIPVSFVYRHIRNPSLPSIFKHKHPDQIGMIIYRTNEFTYVDVHLNPKTRKVGQDIRKKKVTAYAMPFIRETLKLEGKFTSQKLSNPNPMPNEPYIPLLWIVEHILANPNDSFQDPSQATDIEEYKKKVEQTLKDK